MEDPQEVERERRERNSSTGVPPAGWSSVLVDQDKKRRTFSERLWPHGVKSDEIGWHIVDLFVKLFWTQIAWNEAKEGKGGLVHFGASLWWKDEAQKQTPRPTKSGLKRSKLFYCRKGKALRFFHKFPARFYINAGHKNIRQQFNCETLSQLSKKLREAPSS